MLDNLSEQAGQNTVRLTRERASSILWQDQLAKLQKAISVNFMSMDSTSVPPRSRQVYFRPRRYLDIFALCAASRIDNSDLSVRSNRRDQTQSVASLGSPKPSHRRIADERQHQRQSSPTRADAGCRTSYSFR